MPDIGALRLEFPSDLFAVRQALVQIRETWGSWDVDRETASTAEQVTAEVLNNVVEHAYSEAAGGTILVTCQPATTGLTIEVRDRGVPMPGGKLPAGTLAAVGGDLDDLPEGGFGWFMIRSMTTDLTYQRSGDWNVVRYVIPAAAMSG